MNVIVAVSGAALFIGGVIIGVYVWKRRIIARKRRGLKYHDKSIV